MDSFEINKIIAAVIVTILIVIGISKVSDYLFNIDQKIINNSDKLSFDKSTSNI